MAEIGRCLRPGGQLIGTTFLADGTWRSRALFGAGGRRGHPLPPRREELVGWLQSAGLKAVTVGPQRGFAPFGGRRAAG